MSINIMNDMHSLDSVSSSYEQLDKNTIMKQFVNTIYYNNEPLTDVLNVYYRICSFDNSLIPFGVTRCNMVTSNINIAYIKDMINTDERNWILYFMMYVIEEEEDYSLSYYEFEVGFNEIMNDWLECVNIKFINL